MKKLLTFLVFLAILSGCATNQQESEVSNFRAKVQDDFSIVVDKDTTITGSMISERILVTNNSVLNIAGITMQWCYIEIHAGSSISFSGTSNLHDVEIITHGDDALCIASDGLNIIINGKSYMSPPVGCYSDDDLPVELISFTGTKQGENVVLEWATASEQNSSHFDIQRSTDNRNWDMIGSVEAAGNSNTTLKYSFLDENVPSVQGVVYYRLNQIDLDQQSEIFGPVGIKMSETTSEVTVYPNPVAYKEDLNIVTNYDEFEVSIYDAAGKTYFHKFISSNFTSIPMNYGTGMLIVEVKGGRETTTEKIIVE
ncbi:T9SS type A sorting domain-containing protein [Flammeovirga sp. SubArs3]|uniref:T9SS type A sorting domain-containing protein n=1 Tax=Flammeovirga sp. SubArs3 TaxID=2995316 RepID=UPI00248CC662|nr:T9SS type A sorting domain-containing protein [Flammeovirga sp. SubArs3]